MDWVEYINIQNLPSFLKTPDSPYPGKQFLPFPKFRFHWFYFIRKLDIRTFHLV